VYSFLGGFRGVLGPAVPRPTQRSLPARPLTSRSRPRPRSRSRPRSSATLRDGSRVDVEDGPTRRKTSTHAARVTPCTRPRLGDGRCLLGVDGAFPIFVRPSYCIYGFLLVPLPRSSRVFGPPGASLDARRRLARSGTCPLSVGPTFAWPPLCWRSLFICRPTPLPPYVFTASIPDSSPSLLP